MSAQPFPQRARDLAPKVAVTVNTPRLGQALPSAAEVHRALVATQRRLDAALRQIDTLQTQGALLRQEMALLETAAATARQFAYHDELTGLPNRRLLLDRFNQAAARELRRHGQVAILLVDLDRFKSINDVFGHGAGDRVLQEVAMRLAACIRTSDTACRFGGDEFVILLPDLEEEQVALAVAEHVRARVAMPYFINGVAINLSVSIGTAIYPVHGEQYATLMRRADQEMYRNKAVNSSPTVTRSSTTTSA